MDTYQTAAGQQPSKVLFECNPACPVILERNAISGAIVPRGTTDIFDPKVAEQIEREGYRQNMLVDFCTHLKFNGAKKSDEEKGPVGDCFLKTVER